MQPIHSASSTSGSTRGFVTLDPERQGVRTSSLQRRPAAPLYPVLFAIPAQRAPAAAQPPAQSAKPGRG